MLKEKKLTRIQVGAFNGNNISMMSQEELGIY